MNIYVCISGCYSDQSIAEIHTTKDGCLGWVKKRQRDLPASHPNFNEDVNDFQAWDGIDTLGLEDGHIEVCELTDDSPKFLTPVTP